MLGSMKHMAVDPSSIARSSDGTVYTFNLADVRGTITRMRFTARLAKPAEPGRSIHLSTRAGFVEPGPGARYDFERRGLQGYLHMYTVMVPEPFEQRGASVDLDALLPVQQEGFYGHLAVKLAGKDLGVATIGTVYLTIDVSPPIPFATPELCGSFA